MLRLLEARAEKTDVKNIKPVLGSLIDPRLPEGKLDLILCVDVYHEFSHPEHMLARMRKALKKKEQILKELVPNGFKLVEQFDRLPWQHMMFFARDEAHHTK
jgi:hypothetical protein